jgi:ubiquinone/menaquinone biosynthesis C-methylase UbiE
MCVKSSEYELDMIAELFRALCRANPKLKKFLWKHWYEFQAGYYPKTDWSFMNYGYASLDENQAQLRLLEEDEPNRYCIQLYYYVASFLGTIPSLKGLQVLEVGSGRGGGCEYIKRYLHPRSITGIDFSLRAVNLCNLNFSSSGLIFIPGDAEFLPFADNSFDVVINVESSHCYRSIETFVGQVKRVLKKKGHFICADLRWANELGPLQHCMLHSGMTLLREVDISANVVKALSLDHDRKLAHIQKSTPKLMINSIKEYAGLKDSKIYDSLRTGEVRYLSFMLEKE